MKTVEAHVVIVGAGVAGSLLAHRLSAAGLDVLVLEAGKPLESRQAHLHRYYGIAAKVPTSPWEDDPHAPRPTVLDIGRENWADPTKHYIIQDGELPFASTYDRRPGGTGNHWLGTAIRHLPEDFRLQSTYCRGVDWPISYDDLEPWYTAAEHFIGVSGDHDEWSTISERSKAFPMGRIPPTWLDQVVKRRLDGEAVAGKTLKVVHLPQARNSVGFRSRPPCMGNNSCIPICPIEAKYHPSIHLREARKTGARISTRSVAHRIEVDTGGRISGVRFYQWQEGGGVEEVRAVGDTVVVCANTIETAKLLLNSPWGSTTVANSSDQVGRNLTDHVISLAWGLVDEPVGAFRGPLKTAGIDSFREGCERKRRAAWTIAIGNDGWNWPAGAPLGTVKSFVEAGFSGKALRKKLRDHISRQIHFTAELESLPRACDRVTLSSAYRDKLGIPRPVITYGLDDYTKQGFHDSTDALKAIVKKLGSEDTKHATGRPTSFRFKDRDFELRGAGHIMGTTRMGAQADTSVVNAELRSHNHENLYLVGGSVFPTSGTANPTLTIAALALRCADTIARAHSVHCPELKAAWYPALTVSG